MEGKKKRLLARILLMWLNRVRPKGEVHEIRGVYGPGPQKELEGRQIRYR